MRNSIYKRSFRDLFSIGFPLWQEVKLLHSTGKQVYSSFSISHTKLIRTNVSVNMLEIYECISKFNPKTYNTLSYWNSELVEVIQFLTHSISFSFFILNFSSSNFTLYWQPCNSARVQTETFCALVMHAGIWKSCPMMFMHALYICVCVCACMHECVNI
jgi:hypothetical protein